ncbi:ABC transporter ATP-binding protein [Butyricicoccus sp.]|uniref:ABC transporter ATP-binding protein n=1 Tax=Butyricicoccus sp. TaxID=2049021 RepID=UPI003F1442B0
MSSSEQHGRTRSTGELLVRFIPYFRPYLPVLLLDLFCAGMTTLCELILPVIVRYVTNLAQYHLSELTVSVIVRIGILYFILRVIDTAGTYFMANVGHVMGAKMETDMRRELFSHLQKLSFRYYANAKVGQLMARITSDLFDVTEFAHHCPEEFFIAGVKIAVSFAILLQVNIPLTLITFAVLPVMLACCYRFNRRMRETFKEARWQVGEINAQVEDSLLGIRVVKSFAQEETEQEKFDAGNRRWLEIKKRNYFWMGGFNATTRGFDGLMNLIVLVCGSLFLLNGAIVAGDFVAYLLYVQTLLTSIRRIVEFMEQFQRGMTGIDRFLEIMDEKPDITDAPDAVDCRNVRGEIDFDHVSFSYEDDAGEVLANINLHVKAGENIAIVGPSGGGKTTLSNLIPRFYDVSSGSVRLDGVDVRKIRLHSLRSHIGVVQQDNYLFSGTVLHNIEYGRPGATREEIIAAAKLAGADAFISELPNGYDTFIGERGVKLSGGQKQRISIARVFLKDPPVLILDEATSALDNESERLVQQSLDKLAHGRTVFTIAHRLTTIRGADKILVLTSDGIAEQGSHEELIAKGGIYKELYSMYSDMR